MTYTPMDKFFGLDSVSGQEALEVARAELDAETHDIRFMAISEIMAHLDSRLSQHLPDPSLGHDNPDRLELLGKVDFVGMFREHQVTEVQTRDVEEVKAELKQRLSRLLGSD